MNDKQIALLKKIGVSIDDEFDVIENAVANYLTLNCFDKNYNLNEEGLICESILDYIGSQL